jgi:hypothetical protein
MSELFEAVLAIGFTAEAIRAPVIPPQFLSLALPHGVQAFVRDLSSGRQLSIDDTRQLATTISSFSDSALAVFYDNRVALRAAVHYSRGKLVREYDAQDELWVPLDEDGQPLLGGPPLLVGDLSPEEEYETVRNAIDVALSAVGLYPSLDSRSLKQLLCYAQSPD